MCEGEKRRLVIPSDLGYGDRGSPPKIPGDLVLLFGVWQRVVNARINVKRQCFARVESNLFDKLSSTNVLVFVKVHFTVLNLENSSV
jgi:hypothetical protein